MKFEIWKVELETLRVVARTICKKTHVYCLLKRVSCSIAECTPTAVPKTLFTNEEQTTTCSDYMAQIFVLGVSGRHGLICILRSILPPQPIKSIKSHRYPQPKDIQDVSFGATAARWAKDPHLVFAFGCHFCSCFGLASDQSCSEKAKKTYR